MVTMGVDPQMVLICRCKYVSKQVKFQEKDATLTLLSMGEAAPILTGLMTKVPERSESHPGGF